MAPRQRQSSPPSRNEVIPATLVEAITETEHQLLLSPRSRSSSIGSSSAGPATCSHNHDDDSITSKPAMKLLVDHQMNEASDRAREHHDRFNLVALIFVIITTLSNWNFARLLKGYGPSVAWTGRYFYINWVTTVLYFLVDLVWVSRIPICVKSPDVIVKHHIVAIAYLSAPVAFPKYRWFMGACLSVEVNTWFLILRRVIYKRKRPQMLQDVVTISFYVSWIVIRCLIYPAILIIFLQLAVQTVRDTDVLWHWPMMFIPVHFFLCILNLKWSYDLFEPIVRGLLAKDDKEGSPISSGL